MPATDLVRYELFLTREDFRYRTPIKFGGRVVDDVAVVTVHCDAETARGSRNGAKTPGIGSMTMGVAWAWPSDAVSGDVKLQAVLAIAERLVSELNQSPIQGHPLAICDQMAVLRSEIAAHVAADFGLADPIPELAVLLASSPLEAALFDAQGKAVGQSSYRLLDRDAVGHDLSRYLGEAYRGRYLSDYIAGHPVASMPLYHLVGALDPLQACDVVSPIGDGLPETLGEWIDRDGLTHLKIKLAGDDLQWDVGRVLTVHRVATDPGRLRQNVQYAYSLDFNERCESAGYVLELIDSLERQLPEALKAVQYIEQPTHRDLELYPDNTMHRVAERLPVVIDESLVGLASLRLAVDQGYSGIALKACKGHAEALLMAAVARQERLYLCVQDLTCIGISLLHSASLAAHIPGVVAIESNGRQYCPAGNAAWVERYPGMFNVQDGRVPTGCLSGAGLGYA